MSINRHRRRKGRYARPTHRIRNTVIGVVGTIVTLGVIGACSDEPADAPSSWTRGYEPCATEDSEPPCYWDAEHMGNGDGDYDTFDGHSFLYHEDGSYERITVFKTD